MVSVMISMLAAVSLLFAPGSAYGRQRDADSRESRIDQIFRELADSRSPGAAVLVRENGRTLFQRGYGVRDLRTRKAIDSQTNFRLASCTKQFTAMAIMLLVHDGKLRYDERLSDVFPEFPDYGRAITIRNLLNHTSGLPDYEDLMDLASDKRPLWTESRQIQDAEVLALLEKQKRGKFAPGTRWSYSNSGYVVLGLVVARVSGKPFEDFLRERIFAPLKMDHTVLYVKGKNKVMDRSYGHSKERYAFAETDQSATSATLGDGGVYSNLEDLAKWDDALTHGALLASTEMQPALTPVRLPDGSLPRWASGPGDTDPLTGKPVVYGFGWFLDSYQGHERMWHYGDTTGFRTAIERFTENKLTVIVLSNRSDLDPVTLASKVANLYLSTPIGALLNHQPRALTAHEATPFCAALPESLMESELFGHEKGAFTGAAEPKPGLFEVADHGTIFLDEIGDLPPTLQTKLLRALQEREIMRVGATRPRKVDVRVIAATNQDLEALIDSKAFRKDLFHRLNVVSFTLPALRERREDIPLLAAHFVSRLRAEMHRGPRDFSAKAMELLVSYEWPGNVRELQNVIERAVVLGSGGTILPEDLPESILDRSDSATVSEYHAALIEAKRELIISAFRKSNGNYTEAAHLLGLHPNYLHRLIKNLQLKADLR